MSAQGRVMMLSGAAGGIGQGLTQALHALGHRLWLTDRDADGIQAALDSAGLANSERIGFGALDVRDPAGWDAQFDQARERFGEVDVLFNVAGYMRAANLLDTDASAVDMHMDVNTKGVMYGTQAAARRMAARGTGHIVNVASLMGVCPLPGFALYSASKHATRGFSLATAMELREHGVYVTAVCPDAVDTGMLGEQLHQDAASIAFSGPSPLTVQQVVDTIVGRVLRERPMECTIAPPRSGRAVLSKAVAVAPGLAMLMKPVFTRLGEMSQRRARRRAEG